MKIKMRMSDYPEWVTKEIANLSEVEDNILMFAKFNESAYCRTGSVEFQIEGIADITLKTKIRDKGLGALFG